MEEENKTKKEIILKHKAYNKNFIPKVEWVRCDRCPVIYVKGTKHHCNKDNQNLNN